MPSLEIEEMKNCFVSQLLPKKIYLFGSYADNSYNEESDLDFYIVVQDGITDLASEAAKAYKAIRTIKQRPVDILIGTQAIFDERKNLVLAIEKEVSQNGVLIYDAGN